MITLTKRLKGLSRNVEIIIELVRRRHYKLAAMEVKNHFWKKYITYGVARDVSKPWHLHESPPFKLSLRSIDAEGIPDFLRIDKKLDAEGTAERAKRFSLLRTDIHTCYIAVDENSRPCHIHWLIDFSQNKKLAECFHGGFPALEKNEMLLEGGFTVEEYRGKKIMTWAMDVLAKKARDMGSARVIGFIRVENIPSLKASQAAGYKPYCIRIDTWKFFRRKITFSPIS